MPSHSWKPEGAPPVGAWPHEAGEGRADLESTLTRWSLELRTRFPHQIAHLIWDRERVRQLEESVDAVIQGDADCPAHLAAFYRRSLINRLTGLGPLDALLQDDSVTEIMVNGQEAYVERAGRIAPVTVEFMDGEEVAAALEAP